MTFIFVVKIIHYRYNRGSKTSLFLTWEGYQKEVTKCIQKSKLFLENESTTRRYHVKKKNIALDL